jgi:hypothetical protein
VSVGERASRTVSWLVVASLLAVSLAGAPASAESKVGLLPDDLFDVEDHIGYAQAQLDQQELLDRYASFSAWAVSVYATEKAASLDVLAGQGDELVAAMLGVPVASLAGYPTDDVAALAARLRRDGLAGTQALEAAMLAGRVTNLDEAVTARTIAWTGELAQTRSPLVQVDRQLASALPAEQLRVGLYVNASMSALAADFPDTFARLGAQAGTSRDSAAWRAAMQRGFAAATAEPTLALADPCGSAQLAAMATGSRAGAANLVGAQTTVDCGACVASGLYLHTQVSNMFSPQSSAGLVGTSGVANPANWDQLQPWQQEALRRSNPQIDEGVRRAAALPTAADCRGSSRLASDTLSANSGGALGALLSR